MWDANANGAPPGPPSGLDPAGAGEVVQMVVCATIRNVMPTEGIRMPRGAKTGTKTGGP